MKKLYQSPIIDKINLLGAEDILNTSGEVGGIKLGAGNYAGETMDFGDFFKDGF